MQRNEKSRDPEFGGVMHWSKKLPLFYRLLGAGSDRAFAMKVLAGSRRTHDFKSIVDIIPRWKTHWPTQDDALLFFEMLAEKLPTKNHVNGELLKVLTIDQYLAHLPTDEGTTAVLRSLGYTNPSSPRTARSTKAPDVLRGFDDGGIHAILHHDTGPPETIRTSLKDGGKIDQKHYYMDPDSARGWSDLVRAEAYPTYSECKRALETLVKSDGWKEALRSYQPSTIVMLTGGGAATKDLVFLQNLLEQSYITHRVHLHLVDISFYMLTDSLRSIREHMRLLDFEEKVALQGFCGDVLKMPFMFGDLFHEHGSVVFAITGGTIGNFRECDFFDSVGRVARTDDLLVVSADTIDELSAEEEGLLIKVYNHQALRRFLRPVIRTILSEKKAGDTADEGFDIKLLPEGDRASSDVRGSRSICATLKIDKGITLFKSTRYQSSELIAFAGKFGWEPICQVPQDSRFKQFLFRRNESESSGK